MTPELREKVRKILRSPDKDLDALLVSHHQFLVARIDKKVLQAKSLNPEDLISKLCQVILETSPLYNPRVATYTTYMGTIINRAFYSALKASVYRGKAKFHNKLVSLDEPINDEEADGLAYFTAAPAHYDPATAYNGNPVVEHYMDCFRRMSLSDLERAVTLKVYCEGKSYDQVAQELQVKRKAVDNAITRVKRKAMQYTTGAASG